MKKRFSFTVIGDYRTGSTQLCNALTSQPKITCLEEIFNPSYSYDIKIKHPLDRIDEMLQSLDISKEFFGFKMLFHQIDELKANSFDVYSWLASENMKAILIHRDNLLLQYLSYVTARTTDEWQLRGNSHKKASLKQVVLNCHDYELFKENTKRRYEETVNCLSSSNIAFTATSYEELNKNYNQTVAKVVSFLTQKEASNILPLVSWGVKKQNPFRLKDRILNYSEIAKTLETDEHFLDALSQDL
jgi:LPS sulfotransferase NodH